MMAGLEFGIILMVGLFYLWVSGIVFVAFKVAKRKQSPSDRIARKEKEIARLNVEHKKIEAEEKFSDQSARTRLASFSFEGSHVIDDFAALRKKNEEHEKHLRERVM